MKRTTIYLEPELKVLLKLEMLRQKRPMADIVREAVHAYVSRERRSAPPRRGRVWQRPARHGGPQREDPDKDRLGRIIRRVAAGPAQPAMSVLLDTGIVYAYYDRDDAWHQRVRTFIEGEQRGLILPAPVVPEVDHLRGARLGTKSRQTFYKGIIDGDYLVADLPAAGYAGRGAESTLRRAESGIRRRRRRGACRDARAVTHCDDRPAAL